MQRRVVIDLKVNKIKTFSYLNNHFDCLSSKFHKFLNIYSKYFVTLLIKNSYYLEINIIRSLFVKLLLYNIQTKPIHCREPKLPCQPRKTRLDRDLKYNWHKPT